MRHAHRVQSPAIVHEAESEYGLSHQQSWLYEYDQRQMLLHNTDYEEYGARRGDRVRPIQAHLGVAHSADGVERARDRGGSYER